MHEPAGEQDLLLVSAGEGAGGAIGVGGPQLERFDLRAGRGALGALVEEAGRAKRAKVDSVTFL